jgi:hypothetical protein
LTPDGRFIAIDGVHEPRQHPMTRFMLAIDRGRHVRSAERYQALVGEVFEKVTPHLRRDLLRVPYSHLVQVGEGPRSA